MKVQKMMYKNIVIATVALGAAIGLFQFIANTENQPNISSYGYLAMADHEKLASESYVNLVGFNGERHSLSSPIINPKPNSNVTTSMALPVINAVPIGKFLNGNLPTTTPTGNNGIPVLLSQTGAFENLNSLSASPGLIPYDMIEPFWSDGASKQRWMAIPNNGTHDTASEQIQFSRDNAWDFPRGAVLIKHFEIEGQKLETRFEVKGDDDIYYYLTYKWNANQTDATLLNDSLDEDIVVNGITQSWHYPSRNECASCHFPQNGSVLGPKTRNLNKAIIYPGESTASNQLVTLSQLGIINEIITNTNITTYPAVSAKDDLSASLEDRARTYIDVNCASCHNPQVENIALFDARYTTALENQNLIYGTIIYDEGLNNPNSIIPQDVSNSMVHFRMNSTQTGIEMPPLAKDVIDTAGVQLIADWINSLSPATTTAPVAAFSASTVYGTAPASVTFDASASFDTDGDTLTYTWDFGDGNTGLGVLINHVYTNPQAYTATLTVSDGQRSDLKAISIIVNSSSPGTNTVGFTNGTSLLAQNNYSGLPMGVIDMNGDGKDDIVQFNAARNIRIQYQNGVGQDFTSYNFGQVSNKNQWSTAIADFDQNGYNDILSGGAYDNLSIITNNNGSNSYSKTTLENSNIFIQGSNFIDINNDGWPDIFACHDDAESRAFQNNQNGTFTYDPNLIATATVPTSDNSGNYASMWVDYDNDRDMDLYISKCRAGVTDSNDPRRINMLWQNDGNNNFTEVAAEANLKIGDQTWLSDFGDIDNDGDLDAIVINHGTGPNLMRNNGNGTFTEVTSNSGLLPTLNPQNFYGIQGFFRDFNNDGYLDLMVSGDNHYLFYNNGDGTFTNAPNPFNSNKIQSFSVGDLNHDGFLDIYAGYATGLNSPSTTKDEIWLNQGNSNNFLNIQLTGTDSNINGIGARVELYGAWGIQIRDVRSGEGYGLVNSFTQHFGIGVNTQVEKVIIRWPSGTIDEIPNPSINQFLSIVENEVVCSPELVGQPCDDRNSCTTGETYDTDCNCTGGTEMDSDNDGVCDTEDICEGGDDTIDTDQDGTPDFCDTTVCEEITVTINFDQFPTEVSWSLINTNGVTVLSGNGYTSANRLNSITENVCLDIGCYDFIIQDAYGDGICCAYGQGSYALTDANGNILAAGSSYASSETTNFCLNEPIVPVTGIAIAESSVILTTNETQQLNTTITPVNATNTQVVWSSDNTNIATVNNDGEVTAIAQGNTIIRGTTADGAFVATTQITVLTSTIAVTGIGVLPNTATLTQGETRQLSATITPENATNTLVVWSSENMNIANVDSAGMVTAITAGTATIIAKSVQGNFIASATITVEPPTVSVPVYDVTVALATIALNVGETAQLSAMVAPANATDQSVTWFSNNLEIATIDTNTGMITAVGEGEIDVTVVTTDGGYRASTVVKVTDSNTIVAVYNIVLAQTSVSINTGESFTLNANVEPQNATNQTITWFSNNPSIASVDANTGVVTGIGEGEIDITAVTADGGYQASVVIKVIGAPITIQVYDLITAPSSATLNIGNTIQLSAQVQPINASNQEINWFSNNSQIATIDAQTGLVTAIGVGQIDVTAVASDGGYQATTTITVTPQTANIILYPNPSTGIVNIDLSGHMNRSVEISQFNQNNQLLQTFQIDSNHQEEITLNFNAYPAGYYYLLFQSLNGYTTKAFIIRR